MIGESIPAIPAKPRDSDADVKTREFEIAEREHRSRSYEAWAQAFVPKRHQRQVSADSTTPWGQKLNALIGRLGSGFLIAILGDRGTGKTQLGAELIRYHVWHSASESGLYIRAADIFMAIKECYKKDGPTERDQLAQFIGPALLVIDEAHERGETEWENRLLTYVIDRRYGDVHDTLLVSNQEPDAFKVSIGHSIYSRLIETGGLVECDWPSFRQASAITHGPVPREAEVT